MSLRVSATVTDGPTRWEAITVKTPADVDVLMGILGRRNVGVAHAEHSERPERWNDEFEESEADHIVYLGVHGDWGYFDYISSSMRPHVGSIAGDPLSPQWDGTGYIFRAGTGVRLDLFHQLVTDFLNAGTPSERVEWNDDEVHPQPR